MGCVVSPLAIRRRTRQYARTRTRLPSIARVSQVSQVAASAAAPPSEVPAGTHLPPRYRRMAGSGHVAARAVAVGRLQAKIIAQSTDLAMAGGLGHDPNATNLTRQRPSQYSRAARHELECPGDIAASVVPSSVPSSGVPADPWRRLSTVARRTRLEPKALLHNGRQVGVAHIWA